MRTMKYVAVILTVGIMLAYVGCKNNSIVDPGSGPTTDKQAITQMVQSDSLGEISSSDEDEMGDQGLFADDDSFDKTLVSINPLRWGRQITGIVRDVNVEVIGDSVATATIIKTISGNLIVAAAYTDTAHIADTIISKPFTEKVERKVKFRRVARTYYYERNWIPVAITLVEGDSKPESNNLFTISSIEYTFPWGRDTVSDPLATWLRFARLNNGVPVLKAGDSVDVRLTLTSTDPDTECAVLRYKALVAKPWTSYPVLRTRRVHMQLASSTAVGGSFERVYNGRFYAALGAFMTIGRFNAVVDVLSHGTLYDDGKPYSNRYWGLPYVVVWR